MRFGGHIFIAFPFVSLEMVGKKRVTNCNKRTPRSDSNDMKGSRGKSVSKGLSCKKTLDFSPLFIDDEAQSIPQDTIQDIMRTHNLGREHYNSIEKEAWSY
ncbi:hypothetical protein NPIL_269751 [Nephila pilipes]|uniref:Uncharacterized protein n=1 Tax=Nephila pilipes TaxID=299642 RepID=A0A8X6QAS9_NEPPI|nr:hypothetical protein NPIL_269751 [Nephila pilipes]